ncbi:MULTISPECIES: DNA primase family protein [unclassified Thiomonas]|jgi:putative DNA primase/helicase|uniref:DNA primase family protein n=1 Tax=unclassified Thiomonas TaxID=2625466 RepID=UPI000BD49171|nr:MULTISPECIES: DNA primase family protein [unclassified Thiomonas]OZB71358.1 MAG: hypothetical protein B7X30_04665 [Thiomonas sp. 13-64-67]
MMEAKIKTNRAKQPKSGGGEEKSPSAELEFAMGIEANPNYSTDGSILYKWDGDIWEPLEPSAVEKQAFNWLALHDIHKSKANPRLAASCAAAALIKARPTPKIEAKDRVILPLQNGYLHVDFGAGMLDLRNSERGLGLKYKIKCDFEPEAQAPLFHKFLSEILPDEETRNFVQEYAGYTLMPDTRFQSGMWWLGSGANGKSTLVEILAALHSKISTPGLNNLDGFALVSLIGSSLAWVDETPRRIDEQRLKTLISGGVVQIDRKFRDPINLKPMAKWIICGNELPSISDQTHGFWRRFAIIDFKRQFQDHEKDPMLAQKIIQSELSGVLNWAIEGLTRLTQRGRFPALSNEMRAVLASGQRETNNVLAWFQDERGTISENALTERGDVYSDYRFFAQSTGTMPVSAERFWARIKQIAPELEFKDKKIAGKKCRMVNIKLGEPPSAY